MEINMDTYIINFFHVGVSLGYKGSVKVGTEVLHYFSCIMKYQSHSKIGEGLLSTVLSRKDWEWFSANINFIYFFPINYNCSKIVLEKFP